MASSSKKFKSSQNKSLVKPWKRTPVPKYSTKTDSERLLVLLPEEIWRIVLENSAVFYTLENLSHASPFFYDLLLSARTTYLFPQVLKILNKQDVLEDHSIDVRNNETLSLENLKICDTCNSPKVRNSFSDILNLRQVCIAWCQSVDDALKQNIFRRQENFPKLWRIRFGEINPETFLQHFSNSHGDRQKSPFISTVGKLPIENGTQDNQQQWRGVLPVLQKYGKHLTYCMISITDWATQPTECYLRLKATLESMPNLEELYVDYELSQEFVGGLAVLKREIAANPLPTLPKLTYIHASDRNSAIVEEILLRNPQLETVAILGNCARQQDTGINFANVQLTDVCNLMLRINTEEEFCSLEEANKLGSVKYLRLKFRKDLYVPWNRIFKFVNTHYKNTLRALNVRLPDSRDPMEKNEIVRSSMGPLLNIPGLVVVKLKLRTACSLDFLLSLENSLARLEIVLNYDKKSETTALERLSSEQRIQLLQYDDSTGIIIQKSNIWSLMPKLQELVYTGFQGQTYEQERNCEIKVSKYPRIRT